MKKTVEKFIPYLSFISIALVLSFATHSIPAVRDIFSAVPEGLYLAIAFLFAVGYGLNYFAPKTAIPSFVWAIFFGMALQPAMSILTGEIHNLSVLVELLAALVLFGGGVEVPFQSFKKHFGPIASMSFLGTIISVFLFSLALEQLGVVFGLPIPAITFLIIGAILASTDPTAIIPSLKSLKFKKPFLRDLAVSESAVNDVTGTVLTRFFLVALLTASASASVMQAFIPFLKRDTFDALALEIIWGVFVGILGAWVLKKWARRLDREGKERGADPALFFAVPIFCFAAGSIVGGSGFLAAFIAGLLFDGSAPTKSVRNFFETFVDGFIKPVIFLLLGAVVPIDAMLSTALFGVIAAFLFMFVIRPIVVLTSLAPWTFKKHFTFSWRELLFLSFIRETGAIPAVLILVAVGSGVPAADYVFAIGMWVILLTLLIEPPLTPMVAKFVGVTKEDSSQTEK